MIPDTIDGSPRTAICCDCRFSPLDRHDLPGNRPRNLPERTFRCEARGTTCHAESGFGCRHFDRRDPVGGM